MPDTRRRTEPLRARPTTAFDADKPAVSPSSPPAALVDGSEIDRRIYVLSAVRSAVYRCSGVSSGLPWQPS